MVGNFQYEPPLRKLIAVSYASLSWLNRIQKHEISEMWFAHGENYLIRLHDGDDLHNLITELYVPHTFMCSVSEGKR